MWIDEIDYPVFVSSISLTNLQQQQHPKQQQPQDKEELLINSKIPSTLSITTSINSTITSTSPRTKTSMTPTLVAQTPKTIPIIKRSMSKLKKNIWEQTQSDQLLPPQTPSTSTSTTITFPTMTTPISTTISTLNQTDIEEEKKENIEKINLLWDEDIQLLNKVILSESISLLEKHLQPYLDSNSLLNEVIYVSGFDDKVKFSFIFALYFYHFTLFLLFY